jgi:integrase
MKSGANALKSAKIVYNECMDIKIDSKFCLVKRKYKKGGLQYVAAFHKNNDPSHYFLMVPLSTLDHEEGRKRGEAVRMKLVEDKLRQAEREADAIKKDDSLVKYLTDFWQPDSRYVTGKRARNKSITDYYIKQNRRLLELHFMPWAARNGLTGLRQLNSDNLDEWIMWLYRETKRKGDQPSKVNKTRIALFVPLKMAVVYKIIKRNPLLGVEGVAGEDRKREAYTDEELIKIFAIECDRLVKLGIALSAYAGLRISECRGLQWKSIDFENAEINITQQWQGTPKKGKLQPPKWGKSRLHIPIPELLLPILIELYESLRFIKVKERGEYFVLGAKLPISADVLTTGFDKAVEAAGVDRTNRPYHSLRHSWATGMKPYIGEAGVQHALGHSKLETTQGYISITQAERDMQRMAQNERIKNIAI